MSSKTRKQEIKKYFDFNSYVRVVRMAKRPDYDEFKSTSLLVLSAICIVGLFGLIIFHIMELILSAGA